MRGMQVVFIAVLLVTGSTVTVAGLDEEASSRPPIPSAGCGTSTVEPGAAAGSLKLDFLTRRWKMRIPPAHDGTTPTPLVLLLHGGGFASDQIAFLTEDGFSDDEGFVAAAPASQGYTGLWMWPITASEPDLSTENDDIRFVDALLNHLGEELCIDLARVYATGFSAGGVGASILGCALSDRIAAVASVGGMADFGEACETARPVPTLAFHSRLDPESPFDGGVGPKLAGRPLADWPGWQPSVAERMAGIAGRYGCEPEPTSDDLGSGIERLTWMCPADATVELIVTMDDGHGWPGSHVLESLGPLYSATMDLDATEIMWDFFEQHPMPE